MQNDMPVIGWREWVDLTELRCGKIKVKVDTGARSSALHAFNVKEFEKDGETVSYTHLTLPTKAEV